MNLLQGRRRAGLRTTALLYATALLLVLPLAPAASATYTPSCLDGTVAPQLCTLVTTITGSTFGPRDTGSSTAHLRRQAPTGDPRPCEDPSQAFSREEYGGTAVGTVRGFPTTRSTIVTRLGGCRDGVLLIESSATGRGTFQTRAGRLRILDYTLHASTFRVSPNAGFQLDLMWSTKIRDCSPPANTQCTTIYQEMTPFCEFTPGGCRTTGPLTLRGTGVAADMAGQASVWRSGRPPTTERFRYAVQGSVSGRWGRLHLAWRQGEVHNLGVATAPESTGWRVHPG